MLFSEDVCEVTFASTEDPDHKLSCKSKKLNLSAIEAILPRFIKSDKCIVSQFRVFMLVVADQASR